MLVFQSLLSSAVWRREPPHTFLSKYSVGRKQCSSSSKIVRAEVGAGGRPTKGLSLVTPPVSPFVQGLFSLIYSAISAPFHHLQHTSRPDDISYIKQLTVPPPLFLCFWSPACCSAETLESKGNLGLCSQKGGGTLKRSLTETASVLLWQQSYF